VTLRDIGVAMVLLGSESLRDHMLGDPVLTPRHGFRAVRRAGLWLFSSTKLDAGVFNHVAGYGTFADASQRAIDLILRHYADVGRPAQVEVLTPVVSRADRALLERNGFRDEGVIFQCHIRTTTRAPRAHDIPRFSAERVPRADARRYSKLATEGFGGPGVIASVFERGWIRQIQHGRRVAAFMGRVDGAPAATGVLYRGRDLAGLYSGSVLKRYRGRGIQNAMIAARLAYGWSLGLRVFYSWSDPDNSSARNLRDEGFVTRFEVHSFTRDTDR
jgi:RimJ/RimL family protein N-acetyltransferase